MKSKAIKARTQKTDQLPSGSWLHIDKIEEREAFEIEEREAFEKLKGQSFVGVAQVVCSCSLNIGK